MHTITARNYSTSFADLPHEIRAGLLSREHLDSATLRRITSDCWALRIGTGPAADTYIAPLEELLPFLRDMPAPAPYEPPPFDPRLRSKEATPADPQAVADLLKELGL